MTENLFLAQFHEIFVSCIKHKAKSTNTECKWQIWKKVSYITLLRQPRSTEVNLFEGTINLKFLYPAQWFEFKPQQLWRLKAMSQCLFGDKKENNDKLSMCKMSKATEPVLNMKQEH